MHPISMSVFPELALLPKKRPGISALRESGGFLFTAPVWRPKARDRSRRSAKGEEWRRAGGSGQRGTAEDLGF